MCHGRTQKLAAPILEPFSDVAFFKSAHAMLLSMRTNLLDAEPITTFFIPCITLEGGEEVSEGLGRAIYSDEIFVS